jgi:hypothetical protein
VAGYFDGEGCVTIAGTSVSVKITNTYPGTLEVIQARFGGSISVSPQDDPRHRTQFTLSLYGDNAARMLRELLPLLREKKAQAYLALRYRELPAGAEKDALRVALSDLKRITHTPSRKIQ